MKLFSAIFAVSLLVASTTIADAGGNALQSDNCDSGFPKTSVDSSGKQGVHIVQSGGGDQTGSSSTDASQNNPGQESPSQDNPDQNNPGQNTPDQNSTSSDGSQTQTPPVLKGDCILTGDYINNTDVRKCDSIIVDSLRVPPGVTLNLTKLQDNAKVSFKGTSTFGTKVRLRAPLTQFYSLGPI